MGSARDATMEELNPNPDPGAAGGSDAGPSAFPVDGGGEESDCLRSADALSREEVLRRRSRRLRQLTQVYRRQYWALMEEVRVKHRDYYWEYGASPLEEEGEFEENGRGAGPGAGAGGRGLTVEIGVPGRAEENGKARGGLGLGFGGGERDGGRRWEERKRCAFAGCKSKAMPLTRFCHPHILADSKQTLYKACSYVTKSCGQNRPIKCGKPILRASVPSLCHVHFQKAQRSISQALRKAGHTSSSSRPTPKFSVILSEYVRQIQTRRRETIISAAGNVDHMNEKVKSC